MLSDYRKLYHERLTELYRLDCINALLVWDQQVYMPPRASAARAEQVELLSVISHKKVTDPEFLRAVDELYEASDNLSDEDQVNVRETKRLLDIMRKLPDEFIAEISETSSRSYDVWNKARPENDFKAVQPYLEKIVGLLRRFCDLVGYEKHPYDALLEQHDPGSRVEFVKPLLLDLGEQLREIIPSISAKFQDQTPMQGYFDPEAQYQLCRRVVQDLGYNFEIGRLDKTAHPFMTTIGPADFRITNRYEETNFLSGLYGSIHEAGHALYEMGLPDDQAGFPLGQPTSCSIHESQSRLWENPIGHSREFCEYLSPLAKQFFPAEADSLDTDSLWKHLNRVEPTLIRIEADEATYCQHIVIRMLLEEPLLMGDLSVSDLPGAWADCYEKYLGVRPADLKDGVLQDVHWFSGSIGYFPSYALGNLYNAMMMESARKAIPDLSTQISRGDFTTLLGWLHENVHQYGMRYRGPELIKHITGQELSAKPFVNYLKTKFGV